MPTTVGSPQVAGALVIAALIILITLNRSFHTVTATVSV